LKRSAARRVAVYRYGVVETRLGRFRIVTGSRGLVSVELRPDSLGALERRLERALGTRVALERDDRVTVLRQIREYVAGKRRRFETRLDWSLVGAGFRRRILGELAKVRFGHTLSYGELARRAGSPGAARAVGGVMAKNPIPLVVPCHRVLAAGGKIGGFTGGLGLKRALLDLEKRGLGRPSATVRVLAPSARWQSIAFRGLG
jgi:methylated-DNA-[protein]-cysteine S-methyltransferase